MILWREKRLALGGRKKRQYEDRCKKQIGVNGAEGRDEDSKPPRVKLDENAGIGLREKKCPKQQSTGTAKSKKVQGTV